MSAGFVSRRIFLLLLVALFLYLSLYTWNLRYGYLDRLSEITGLEIAGFVLRPGNWVADEVSTRWRRYVHLVDVEQENERLRGAIARMALDMARLREDSAKAKRLEHSLEFNPPEQWQRQGARVIAHRLGPTGSLETFLVDKGTQDGVYDDAPVITADGAVGRILRVSPNNATVLLLSDPNSRIPVLGRNSRTTGVLMGQGQGELLKVNYVPLNEPINEGEILVSSGLARVFPKGIPVARVVTVERSDISLFKTVLAEPLVDVRNLEEILLLTRMPEAEPEPGQITEVAAPSLPAAAPLPTKTGATGSPRSQAVKTQEAHTQKPASVQPQAPRRQPGQERPAEQERSTSAAKPATVKPQTENTPNARVTQTYTPPAVQVQKPRDSQTPKPQAVQAQSPAVAQSQDQRPAKPAEQRMVQERVPVQEEAFKPEAATPQTQAQTVSTQSTPAQDAQNQAAPMPAGVFESEKPARSARPPQPSASSQPEVKVDQVATPAARVVPVQEAQSGDMERQSVPAQPQEQASQPKVQSVSPASQSTWPPALQSPSLSAPTDSQPASAGQAESAE